MTLLLSISGSQTDSDQQAIRTAADFLSRGRLVAFPTETVYGLGADARNESAIARIFAAKGRPSNNPLIVHVDGAEAAKALVTHWPPEAEKLAKAFWPGPLTIVLPALPGIAPAVQAGGPTIAIRVPRHPVALALLRAAQFPVAAPSANRSERLSPTSAGAVLASLPVEVDLVLDGGPCEIGIESTVVSLASETPQILRPGMVTREEIAAVIGVTPRSLTHDPKSSQGKPLMSPGLMPRHYSPSIPLIIHDNPRSIQGSSDFLVLMGSVQQRETRLITLSNCPRRYAADLYEVLRAAERSGARRILLETPPDSGEWEGIRDRLQRAAWKRRE